MITKETLFATRRDATPAQKMDLRLDVEVPAGTQLLKCEKLDDRWLITVDIKGQRMDLVTYRDPIGKPPRARPARSLRYTCQFGSSALNAGCQRERSEKSTDTQLQTCAVWVDGTTYLIGEEFLTPHKPKTTVKKGAVEHGVSQRRRQTVSDG